MAKKATQATDVKLQQVAIATDGTPMMVPTYPVGSEALAALLSASYGFSVADAEKIKAEREKDPALHPYELYKRACAMLEALANAPQVVSTRPGWRRSRSR